jgi:hypothetical protein
VGAKITEGPIKGKWTVSDRLDGEASHGDRNRAQAVRRTARKLLAEAIVEQRRPT